MGKVILISGGSSGIGCEAARMLSGKGHKVYAAARRMEKLVQLAEYGIVPVRLDVTSKESVEACVQSVIDAEGRIDVLVNNAGYGSLGPLECVSMEEAHKQMDTNLFGAAMLSRLVIPYMREQRSGRIINISSVAGRTPVQFGGWYNISKYALEALGDTMRIDLKQYGIDVVTVEPSGIKTPWGAIAADNLEACTTGTMYEEQAKREAELFRKAYSGNIMSSPSVVARAITRAACARRPHPRYHPGFGSRMMIALHSILPVRWWDALTRLLAAPFNPYCK